MRIIRELIIKEFLQIRRDKRMLPIIFIVPILQIIILGYAATLDIKNIGLLICDLDGSFKSREFVSQFVTSGHFTLLGSVESPKQIDTYLDRSEVTLAIIIPRDFSKKILSGNQADIALIADGSDANTANISLSYATQIISRYSKNILAKKISALPIRIPLISAEPRVWFNPDLRSANFMVPGVIALVLLIITMTLTSVAIVREKEIGTLEQLLVTPIKPYQLIIGKITPYVIIGFIDMALVLTIAVIWFDIPIKGSVILLFGLSALFIMTTLGLGIFVSTISRTQQQAMMTAQFFVFFPFIFLSGFTFPIDNMPWIIRQITYLIPLRYFLEIIRGIILKGASLDILWQQTLALIAFGVVILTFSIFRFRNILK
ncbi:MAG: ABC transporter permease [Bacteroidetes bacterium]|nr:ABC transporter permease [Bacteroidota bacterium]MBU1421969.1 ABC transporter permease [Bacteroidota bacterium]MBU2471748.1 ABC transporter permease [Bacteroidota bacterium]